MGSAAGSIKCRPSRPRSWIERRWRSCAAGSRRCDLAFSGRCRRILGVARRERASRGGDWRRSAARRRRGRSRPLCCSVSEQRIAEAPFVTRLSPKCGVRRGLHRAAGANPLRWVGSASGGPSASRGSTSCGRGGLGDGGGQSRARSWSTESRPATRLDGRSAARWSPTAERGPEAALLDNRALALGNALNGGLDSALLTPGVSGLRLERALEHWHHPLRVSGDLRLAAARPDLGRRFARRNGDPPGRSPCRPSTSKPLGG